MGFDNLTWKIKQFFRNLLPLVIIGAILYGVYGMYKKGAFRHGIRPAITSVLKKIPYFGSRFKHYGYSYAPKKFKRDRGSKYYRGKKYYRRHRRR